STDIVISPVVTNCCSPGNDCTSPSRAASPEPGAISGATTLGTPPESVATNEGCAHPASPNASTDTVAAITNLLIRLTVVAPGGTNHPTFHGGAPSAPRPPRTNRCAILGWRGPTRLDSTTQRTTARRRRRHRR